MKSINDIVETSRAYVAAGQVWRAKELLGGNIAAGRVDPALLEEYGRLLDSVGDRIEAGKYLFLCGVRAPEYAEPIALFFRRYARLEQAALVRHFPAAVRRQGFDALAIEVRDALGARGVTPDLFAAAAPRVHARQVAQSWKDRVAVAAAFAVLLLFLAALVLGARQIVAWLWRLMAS